MSFNIINFAVTIIAFVLLYLLLNKYAFGPLFATMEKRREYVQSEIKKAEASRAESVQYLEDQKAALDTARKEAFGIVEQARQASSRQAEEIIHSARNEANRVKEDAVQQIESEKNKAITALRSEVSDMSVRIATKIIEKEIDPGSQKKLVDDYLKEIGDGQS
ncbi:F0F1 ATP synthase subunit B [Gorillibacterium timonense]|uniref:F0F1 ATP synthase subunit B n=1 Tax=Gorillibacterium timonense TaxID=1689269 RepID=UPI00071D90F1|nr:F0F1 ATP synthase subunit B [Gorillibacterium timonense]